MFGSYLDYKKRLKYGSKLATMLSDPLFPYGRSLKALSTAVQLTQKDTQALLQSMKARKIKLKKNTIGYTLRKKV